MDGTNKTTSAESVNDRMDATKRAPIPDDSWQEPWGWFYSMHYGEMSHAECFRAGWDAANRAAYIRGLR